MNFQYFGTKHFFMFKTSLLLLNFCLCVYSCLPRKCDYRTDRRTQTDAGQSDPDGRYVSQATQQNHRAFLCIDHNWLFKTWMWILKHKMIIHGNSFCFRFVFIRLSLINAKFWKVGQTSRPMSLGKKSLVWHQRSSHKEYTWEIWKANLLLIISYDQGYSFVYGWRRRRRRRGYDKSSLDFRHGELKIQNASITQVCCLPAYISSST